MAAESTSFSTCLYFSSGVLTRLLNKIAEESFRPVGMSPSYAFLLMTINDRPGIQPSEISTMIRLTPSTVSRLIEKLEHQGYLTRKSKGRATLVEPTRKSLDLDEEIRKCWNNLKSSYNNQLGDRYAEVLTEMTHKASEKLDK